MSKVAKYNNECTVVKNIPFTFAENLPSSFYINYAVYVGRIAHIHLEMVWFNKSVLSNQKILTIPTGYCPTNRVIVEAKIRDAAGDGGERGFMYFEFMGGQLSASTWNNSVVPSSAFVPMDMVYIING